MKDFERNFAAVIPMIPRNAVEASRLFLAPVLANAACVVDATAGNGHDSLFLCKQTKPECRVWAFDIQAAAAAACGKLLAQHGFADKVRLIQADHALLREVIREPVDAAIFNLGYLPGHDHAVTTRVESLAPALDSLRDLLAPGGRIALVAYPGHSPGRLEMEFLEEYLPRWSQQVFTISRLSFINQKNYPAVLYSIGKTGRKQHENTSPDQSKGNRGATGDPNPG